MLELAPLPTSSLAVLPPASRARQPVSAARHVQSTLRNPAGPRKRPGRAAVGLLAVWRHGGGLLDGITPRVDDHGAMPRVRSSIRWGRWLFTRLVLLFL